MKTSFEDIELRVSDVQHNARMLAMRWQDLDASILRLGEEMQSWKRNRNERTSSPAPSEISQPPVLTPSRNGEGTTDRPPLLACSATEAGGEPGPAPRSSSGPGIPPLRSATKPAPSGRDEAQGPAAQAFQPPVLVTPAVKPPPVLNAPTVKPPDLPRVAEEGPGVGPPSPRRTPEGSGRDWELQLGQVWIPRLGMLVLLTAIAMSAYYAYETWIAHSGAAIKSGLLAGISLGLVALGRWLEKRPQLAGFGGVVFAGGLASSYFTVFAIHALAQFRLIESPVWGGIALMGAAGILLSLAWVRQSQLIASMSLGFAFYVSAIHPSSVFAAWATGLLGLAGVALVARFPWTIVGFGCLAATFGGFLYWQILQSAPSGYEGIAILGSYWLTFAAACKLGRGGLFAQARERLMFASANNIGFFGLAFVSMALQGMSAGALGYISAAGFLALGWLGHETRTFRAGMAGQAAVALMAGHFASLDGAWLTVALSAQTWATAAIGRSKGASDGWRIWDEWVGAHACLPAFVGLTYILSRSGALSADDAWLMALSMGCLFAATRPHGSLCLTNLSAPDCAVAAIGVLLGAAALLQGLPDGALLLGAAGVGAGAWLSARTGRPTAFLAMQGGAWLLGCAAFETGDIWACTATVGLIGCLGFGSGGSDPLVHRSAAVQRVVCSGVATLWVTRFVADSGCGLGLSLVATMLAWLQRVRAGSDGGTMAWQPGIPAVGVLLSVVAGAGQNPWSDGLALLVLLALGAVETRGAASSAGATGARALQIAAMLALAWHGNAALHAIHRPDWVTSTWAACGLLGFLAGFGLNERALRRVGLGLLLLALGRLVVVDLWQMGIVWRCVSCLSLGLGLMTAGYIYNAARSRLKV